MKTLIIHILTTVIYITLLPMLWIAVLCIAILEHFETDNLWTEENCPIEE